MHVTYSPADGPTQTWEFAPRLVKAGAAEVIEKRMDQRFDEWVDAVLAGSAKARRVLLWHLLAREHPFLRFEDAPDFAMGELVVDRDLSELIEWRKVIDSYKGSESVRQQGLDEVDDLIAIEQAKGAELPGKAISLNGVPSTLSTLQPSSI